MADTTLAPRTRRRARGPAHAVVHGLDRVLWQRISPDESRSVVAGVRHRHPAYLTVSLAVAARLVEAGIPTVVAGYEERS